MTTIRLDAPVFSFTVTAHGTYRAWISVDEDLNTKLYKGSDLYNKIVEHVLWHGHDQSGKNYISFEIRGEKNMWEIRQILKGAGYTFSIFDGWMKHDWCSCSICYNLG